MSLLVITLEQLQFFSFYTCLSECIFNRIFQTIRTVSCPADSIYVSGLCFFYYIYINQLDRFLPQIVK